MSKKHHGEKEGKSKGKKSKAEGVDFPVLATQSGAIPNLGSSSVSNAQGAEGGAAILQSGAQTDAAHDQSDEHARLIDHTYLQEEQFGRVAETLQRNVATTISLYLKFKKFHWDIRGSKFHSLHETYDQMAGEVFESIDPLAERLVMLGGSPLAAPEEIARYAAVRVPTETIHGARQQLEQLVRDHTAVTRALRDDIEKTEDAGDPVTADMYNDILLLHDKHRWMLSALLDDKDL